MRLIDVCIPHFGEDQAVSKLPETTGTTSNSFSLPTNLFGPTEQEYNVDDDDQDEEADSQAAQQDEFYEAEQGTVDVSSSSTGPFRMNADCFLAPWTKAAYT